MFAYERELESDARDREDLLDYVERILRGIYGDSLRLARAGGRGASYVIARVRRREGEVEALLALDERPVLKVRSTSSRLGRELAEILERAIETYLSTGGRGLLHCVYVQGRPAVPTSRESLFKRLLEKLLLGNTAFALALPMLLYCFAYALVGSELAPIALIAILAMLQASSHRLLGLLGDWEVDRDHRHVYSISISVPMELYDRALSILRDGGRYRLKERLLREARTSSGTRSVAELLRERGLPVSEGDVRIEVVDLYGLVEGVFSRYRLRAPRVYLLNTIVPNAVASGIDPRASSLLLTSGLLVTLNEEELKAVIGHEASHLKRRDMLSLYAASSVLYLFQVYALPAVPALSSSLPAYAISSCALITLLFWTAKLLEIRADLEVARVLGLARSLSSALEKICRRRPGRSKLLELLSWLAWDPHPPIGYRVRRLRELAAR